MDVNELKAEKKALEDYIARAINDFEKETECVIDYVHTDRTPGGVHVTLEVTI